ncbi:hypothetical protein QBC44DRAFT_238935 [Cladorrhinum sp. PSN332]|nr:hypothetical protein QBC44DRAFT_238935 [Cladorrhinum sp. PSN332]
MGTAAPQAPGSSQDELPIDYAAIRAWLAQQESNPAREITPMQKRALNDLTRSLTVEEPPLGTEDWISILEKYRNAHKAEGSSHAFKDEPATNGKWVCICTFQGHKDSTDVYTFPTGDIPPFGKKKDAKRYAAKCCVEWLMSERYMPADGINVAFPLGLQGARYFKPALKEEPAPPPNEHHRASAPLPAELGELEGESGGARLDGGPLSTNKTSPDHAIDVHDDDIPAAKRVEKMCRRLGLVTPRYVITASNSNADCYDGYADFSTDAVAVSANETRVTCVHSKRFTREAIGEKVLEILFEMEKDRMGITEQMIDAKQLIDEMLSN